MNNKQLFKTKVGNLCLSGLTGPDGNKNKRVRGAISFRLSETAAALAMWTLNSPSNHTFYPQAAKKLNPGRNRALEYSIATQALGLFLIGTCILVRVYAKVYLTPPFRLEDCKRIFHCLDHSCEDLRCEDACLLGMGQSGFRAYPFYFDEPLIGLCREQLGCSFGV